MIEKLSKLATYGGTWVLYVMIALSIASIAIMIERAIFFARRRDDDDALARKVVSALRRHDVREADRLLGASPSVAAAAVRPALEWLDGGPDAIEEIVEAEMTKQRKELEWGMTFLGTLGTNAPFVGLLGTVLTYAQAVTVAAIASGVPAAGVYANPGQYLAWSGDSSTPEWIVLVKLQRASEDIDRALMGAVYPVNANGMPTDPMVIDVLMRATFAQAQWLIGDNDDSGLKRQYLSTSVGGVSQTRAASMAALEMPPLAPRALSILHVSGVVPSAALIAW